MKLYPIFLKLEGKKCLVIGGGKVAFRKIKALFESGAKVTIISVEIIKELKLYMEEKKIKFINRKYNKGDLNGYYLVIAATNSTETNKEIYDESLGKNILVNCVDDPDNSDFYLPSVARAGDLQIAISTSGKSPLFAKKTKEFLENKFYPGLKDDIKELGDLRNTINNSLKNNAKLKKQKMDETLTPKINKILGKIK